VNQERSLDLSALALAAIAAFWPVLRDGFVNWDDPTVLVDNTHLDGAGVLAWSFTTTEMGHYQPLAWLFWSAAKSIFGLSATAFHGLSLAVHVLNGTLVYSAARRLAEHTSLTTNQRRAAAFVTASIFLVHPLQVEVVAWASAFPYILSLTLLLAALLAYIAGLRFVSIACYATSLLVRATAIGFPVVLFVLDLWPLKRHTRTRIAVLALEKVPFAVLAGAAAIGEIHARDIASIQEIGVGARLTMAVTAPFVYLWRTLWPARLSPLNPLPIAPVVHPISLMAGTAAVVAITVTVWILRHRLPALGTAWATYAVLLIPVVGLTPSGLQATADRYLYIPNIVVAMLAATVIARRLAAPTLIAAAVVLVGFSALTWRQTTYWRTSITLWTRAAEIDPRNDVATYNLAVALAEAGREEEAIGRYEETLRLVPDHDLARRHLAVLQVARAKRDARAHADRGVRQLQGGRFHEAAIDLRAAIDGGVKDPAVANALAFALVETGDTPQAVAVLTQALVDRPDEVNVKHNLARLLATAPDPKVRDVPRALRLALEVCERTANRDPRALDTLAAAYAASGRIDLARATAVRAEALARALGDDETAAAIAAHARTFR
jgi:protein O-mannosyl-transferase